jgi:molybdopterin-guanine dinucleotide biosynthesis protein B
VTKRLHVIGGKNHGKTTLIVDLIGEFSRMGVAVGTVKHTHHRHELDVPGKDSYRHREAGAKVVGILSPSLTAIFLPHDERATATGDRYAPFAPMLAACQIVLVEGDSQADSLKIEVWRKELGTPPLAAHDPSILAVVTDDVCPVLAEILTRSRVAHVASWILDRLR